MFQPLNRLSLSSFPLAPAKSALSPSSSEETLVELFEEGMKEPISEEDKSGVSRSDLVGFVYKFNRFKANLDVYRDEAYSLLARLKRQVWGERSTKGFPNDDFVEGTRDGFYILFCCHDQKIREASLQALIDLLEVDPLLKSTAGGLIDLQKKLLKAMDLKRAENYPISVQRLLSKAYALCLECILLQESLGALNAVQQSTKDAIWDAAEKLMGINLHDEETSFWSTAAVQAAERLKSNRSVSENFMGKFSITIQAFIKVASACHYPDYVATATDAPGKIFEAMNDLRGLFYHIEWHEHWYERILVLKKLSRFALHDSKEFLKVVEILQNEKIDLTFSSNLAEKAAEKFIQKNDMILYGMISLIEAAALQTSKQEVQEMCLKLLIQNLNINSNKIQKRIILSFFAFLEGGHRLANTARLILLLLNASQVVHSKEAKQKLNSLSDDTSEVDELKHSLKHKDGEEQYFGNLLRFLILRLADVRQLERAPSQDFSSQSFVTLLASSYNEQIIGPLLDVVLNIFPIPETGMSLKTPFHIAAVMNRPFMVRHLIRFKTIFPIDGCDTNGDTALHLAVRRHQKDTVTELLKGGAKTDIQNLKGVMPLHEAVIDGDRELIILLLNAKANINALTNDRMTALDLALQKDQVLLYQFLFVRGGVSADQSQTTHLMLAARHGSEAILMQILKGYKESDRQIERKEALAIYLFITADTVTMNCTKKFALFHRNLLREFNHYKQVFQLFSGGPDFEEDGNLKSSLTYKNLKEIYLSIPHPIRHFGNTKMIRYSRKRKHLRALKNRLKSHPGELNQSNDFGMTPLLVACAFNQTKTVALLLDHGANAKETNCRKFSALHYAAMQHNLEMVAMLVEKEQGLIELVNDFGDTPFLILTGLLDQHYPQALKSLCKTYHNFPVSSDYDHMLFTLLRPDDIGKEALHHAVLARNCKAIDWLCEQDENFFWQTNRSGLLPIEETYRLRDSKTFDCLVRSFAKGNLVDFARKLYDRSAGKLSLANMAVELSCIKLLRDLLQEEEELVTLSSKGSLQETPLHVAARIDQVEVLELFQDLNLQIDIRDSFENTPAHIAAYYGNCRFIQAIPKDHSMLKTKNRDQRYPALVAASQVSIEGLDLFIHLLGDDPDILISKDLFGDTLLHTVCKFGVRSHFMILLDRLQPHDLNAVNDEGDSPLHLAAAFGRIEMIEKLVEKGAKLELRNGQGATPLMHAAQEGKTLAVMKLVELGADLHICNVEGEGMLHLAVHNLHVQTVKELIRLEKETIHPSKKFTMSQKVDLNNETALLELPKEARGSPSKVLAAYQIFKMLIDIGLNIHHRNDQGEHLMHLFAEYSDPSFLEYLFEDKDLWWVKDLKINSHDHNWDTPLHKAAKAGRASNVKMLLKLGAKGNLKNRQGMTPLLLAVKLRHARVWEVMFQSKRIYLGANDHQGKTLVHHLLDTPNPLKENELLFLKEVLKKRPGLVFRKDNKGWTALHYLALHGHECALDLLMRYGSLSKEQYQHFVYQRSHSGDTAAEIANESLAAKIRRYDQKLLGSEKPKWAAVKDIPEEINVVADPLSAFF